MPPDAKLLGVLTPMGGGDPVPLRKDEMTVGRRRSCDICLDFENVSGKHCALRLINGIWHVRDLGSTNGTTVNGQRLDRDRDRGILPDDELGISGHLFSIAYDPATTVATSKHILEAEVAEPRRRSLLEMAGLEDPDEPPARERRPKARPAPESPRSPSASRPPDARGEDRPSPPKPSDDDSGFFRLIEDEVSRADP